MLPCIACKKHVSDDDDEEEEEEEGEEEREEDGEFASATKVQVKSLSSQLKDVVLKVSAAYRQCRPCASRGSSLHKPRGLASHDEQELTGTSDASSSSEGWINNNSNKPGSLKKNHVNQSYNSSTTSTASNSSASEPTNKQDGSPRDSQPSPPPSTSTGTVTEIIEDDTGQEWVAQVEPGVLITFIATPNGENELKRIRFSRELFNKWQAEAWWGENCERVHELYNVSGNDHSFPGSRREGETKQDAGETLKQHECSSDNIINSNEKQKSDELTEWVEEDEPGVYITVRLGPTGNRELKRVRFSRERFSEKQAKLWWERNRFRIHDNYL